MELTIPTHWKLCGNVRNMRYAYIIFILWGPIFTELSVLHSLNLQLMSPQ